MRPSSSPFEEPDHISWSALKTLWPFLLEYRARVFLALFFLILAKAAGVGLPFVLKYLVDDLDASPVEQALAVPLALLLAYGAIRFSAVLFGELRDTVFGRVTERAMRRVGLQVFEHLHRLDLSFHLDRRTGGLSRDIERGTSGINFLMRFMLFNIVPTLLEISFVAVILMVNYDVWFAVIVLVSVFAYGLWSVKATQWRTEYVREANRMDNQSNTRAVDSLLNYETVKYFANEFYESKKYDDNLEGWEQARRKNRLSLFTLNGGQAFIVAVAMTSMLILAAYKVRAGEMTLGDFVLINAFMMQIFMPLNFLGFVYREIKGSLANIERMFDLLAVVPKVQDVKDAPALEVSKGLVEFKDIAFHYDAERPIIRGVSFSVLPGQKVAVVGASGAGKSTIGKLFFRFYEPVSGEILIDGQDIGQISQHSLRQSIGVVPQDTVLFNDTLYNNILYGRPDASKQEVMQAVSMAHLQQFVESLPKGMDTPVGERGLKLSGGEKQRVAIARTILKQPSILLFDEATSSLDSESEQSILRAIQEVAKGRSSLVIAHRLSTIVDADNIIVLDAGKVVEQGSHIELLDLGGRYASLWKMQQEAN